MKFIRKYAFVICLVFSALYLIMAITEGSEYYIASLFFLAIALLIYYFRVKKKDTQYYKEKKDTKIELKRQAVEEQQRLEQERFEQQQEAERLKQLEIEEHEKTQRVLEELAFKQRMLREEYSTHVAGVSYRQDNIRKFILAYASKTGTPKYNGMSNYEIKEQSQDIYEYPKIERAEVELADEPNNQYDKNAIMVLLSFADTKKFHVGYIPKENQEKVRTWIEEGRKVSAEVTGGKYKEPDYVANDRGDYREIVHNRQKNYNIRLYFEH